MRDDPLALIEDVVAGRYLARETGKPLVSGIGRIAIEPTLEGWEGELVGGLFHGNYPGGTGLTAGAVFGRRAGQHAATTRPPR